MSINALLHAHLEENCPDIHATRLQAVMDVATGLQRSRHFSISAIGKCLQSDARPKHRIKKVDRLLGNKHLYAELADIYKGLSAYVFRYIVQDSYTPVVVDLCFLKDSHDIQMLSAEVATKGRSIPIYREVFESRQLKHRAREFLAGLADCIPSDRDILIIMDAGFGDEWFEAIESRNWHWLVRARAGKYIKLSELDEWQEASAL